MSSPTLPCPRSLGRPPLLVAPLLASLLAVGCAERDPPTYQPLASGNPSIITSPDGGVGENETLDSSLSWQGYAEGSSELGTISIADYHDPDGQLGIHALLLVEISTSCPACQSCATGQQTQLDDGWTALGVKVVHLIMNPGTTTAAEQWKLQYDATWAVAADPNFTFAKVGTNHLPVQVLVDPRTLKVTLRKEGYSTDFPEVAQLAQQNAP